MSDRAGRLVVLGRCSVTPTAMAILLAIISVGLSAMRWPIGREPKMIGVRATTISAVIGVTIVALLERLDLFPKMPPDGQTTWLAVGLIVVLQIATVLAVLTLRRRRTAPRT